MVGLISQDFDFSNREDLLKAKAALLVEYGSRASVSTVPLPDGSRRMITNLSNQELIILLMAIEMIERKLNEKGGK